MSTALGTVLVVGASRGMGLAVAAELLDRGGDVVATVRGEARTGLHDLAEASRGRLRVETVDMTAADQVAALRRRLEGTTVDVLLVNTAITRGDVPVGEVPTEVFVEVMVTNALSPLRVVESLLDLVPPTGAVAIMSSSQGSISLNTRGGQEVYRASKAALNQLVRSLAARQDDDSRTFLLLDPGHVRTGLGGPNAPLGLEDSVPPLVDVLLSHRRDGGLAFRNRHDEIVPW